MHFLNEVALLQKPAQILCILSEKLAETVQFEREVRFQFFALLVEPQFQFRNVLVFYAFLLLRQTLQHGLHQEV